MGFLSRFFNAGPNDREIDVAGTLAAMSEENAQIVDCRTEREWKSGHIKGATLVPLGTIGERAGKLDQNRPVIVVCKSGHRSSIGARQLAAAGFPEAKSMKGGIGAWKRAGQPLVN